MMTVETVLVLITNVAPLIPVPAAVAAIQAGVLIARELEKSGLLDTNTPIEMTTIGQYGQASIEELKTELLRNP